MLKIVKITQGDTMKKVVRPAVVAVFLTSCVFVGSSFSAVSAGDVCQWWDILNPKCQLK